LAEADVEVFLDLGASGGRFVRRVKLANTSDATTQITLLYNSVVICDRVYYERRERRQDASPDGLFAGTYYINDGERCWIVGLSASDVPQATDVSEAKSSQAIAKILCAVGIVLSDLPSDLEVNLSLHILLPFDEIRCSGPLKVELIEQLTEGFGFNGQTIKPAYVPRVECYPEGSGLSSQSVDEDGILMMGHRDVTWLALRQGQIDISRSKTIAGAGMIRLLSRLSQSSKNEIATARAIYAAGHKLQKEPLIKLVGERNLPLFISELEIARRDYLAYLLDELSRTGFPSSKKIIMAGGGGDYWLPSIKKECKTQQFDQRLDLVESFERSYPSIKVQPPIRFRGLDLFGLTLQPLAVAGLTHA
jgi:hypothetical protein